MRVVYELPYGMTWVMAEASAFVAIIPEGDLLSSRLDYASCAACNRRSGSGMKEDFLG